MCFLSYYRGKCNAAYRPGIPEHKENRLQGSRRGCHHRGQPLGALLIPGGQHWVPCYPYTADGEVSPVTKNNVTCDQTTATTRKPNAQQPGIACMQFRNPTPRFSSFDGTYLVKHRRRPLAQLGRQTSDGAGTGSLPECRRWTLASRWRCSWSRGCDRRLRRWTMKTRPGRTSRCCEQRHLLRWLESEAWSETLMCEV